MRAYVLTCCLDCPHCAHLFCGYAPVFQVLINGLKTSGGRRGSCSSRKHLGGLHKDLYFTEDLFYIVLETILLSGESNGAKNCCEKVCRLCFSVGIFRLCNGGLRVIVVTLTFLLLIHYAIL